MYVVYLQRAERGLTTFINGKRYFIDRKSEKDLEEPGIAFVEISKEMKNYGFLNGSYHCVSKNKPFSDLKDTIELDELEGVYCYGGCNFYRVRDLLSDGEVSVYYWVEGMSNAMALTACTEGSRAVKSNAKIINYLMRYGKDITDQFKFFMGINLKDLYDSDLDSFMEAFCKLAYFYIPIKKVYIVDNHVLKISIEDKYSKYNIYYVYKNGKWISLSEEGFVYKNTLDITDQVHNYISSHYIVSDGFPISADGILVEKTVDFLGSSKKVKLMSKSYYSKANWECYKEEVSRSVKEYEEWVKSLKRYVTVDSAKQYRNLFLDRILWEVG